ncbi:hypothetical protein BS50DRAFT_591931 [Corynespora cassiicola Philippines]|uniref:Uncharacterized protein n=1 Tax=Corynespora cassiicola Philippines TaxID=1448308 RepID=A0A2T2NB65_CORCC|nr:hypothetical protein BS50DRAFT_591931 [Corynespora cassiicola Philippines]
MPSKRNPVSVHFGDIEGPGNFEDTQDTGIDLGFDDGDTLDAMAQEVDINNFGVDGRKNAVDCPLSLLSHQNSFTWSTQSFNIFSRWNQEGYITRYTSIFRRFTIFILEIGGVDARVKSLEREIAYVGNGITLRIAWPFDNTDKNPVQLAKFAFDDIRINNMPRFKMPNEHIDCGLFCPPSIIGRMHKFQLDFMSFPGNEESFYSPFG